MQTNKFKTGDIVTIKDISGSWVFFRYDKDAKYSHVTALQDSHWYCIHTDRLEFTGKRYHEPCGQAWLRFWWKRYIDK